MKTVRFSKVLEACGKPEIHLLLIKPEKDKPLSNAIRSNRVMTLYQGSKGTDYARVGFEEGKARQYLIFPKSLHAFADQQIVGLNYDLLESGDAEAEEPPASLQPSQLDVLAEEKAPLEPADHKREAKPLVVGSPDSLRSVAPEAPTQARPKKSKPPVEKDHAPPVLAEEPLDLSPAESNKPPAADSKQLAKIKNQVRKAMDLLEEGKPVAAYNALKEIVDLPPP